MTTFDKEISSKVYRQRFDEGKKFPQIIGKLLKAEGFEVFVPNPRKPLPGRDTGDIQILVNGKVRFIIEVKSRKLSFTGIHDYPYSEVIIDNLDQFLHKKFTVAAIVIISQFTLEKFVIPMSTKKHWYEKLVLDTEKCVSVKKLFVHKMYAITWEDFLNKLKEKLNKE